MALSLPGTVLASIGGYDSSRAITIARARLFGKAPVPP
jgi:hypothetical protein